MVQPPFLYDAVRVEKPFDPKAISRASKIPPHERPKQDGPLISFNRHPDSYLFVPYGNLNVKYLNPSVKGNIKWAKMIQLGLRSLELLASVGILVLIILIKNVDAGIGWVAKVVPVVAALHTMYAIYHLSRRASGRTPGSSASYALFAGFVDVSIIPLCAFIAVAAKTRQLKWQTILSNQDITPSLTAGVLYLAIFSGALFTVSLGISTYLFITFKKITQLPPDCNPLEDNLTSRSKHKHKSSNISTTTTSNQDRLSTPLESMRSSGAAYGELCRPPTLPFFQTRSDAPNKACGTYKPTTPSSRDSGINLPERNYQIGAHSPQSSIDQNRRSMYSVTSSPTKRDFYNEVPLNDISSPRKDYRIGQTAQAWFTTDSLTDQRGRSASPRKNGHYHAVEEYDHQDEPRLSPTPISQWLTYSSPSYPTKDLSTMTSQIHPLAGNPLTPRHSTLPSQRDTPLGEISLNRNSVDISERSRTPYGNGKPSTVHEEFKAKFYGELKPGTPPLLVGANRQVSSGNDYSLVGRPSMRDVSGKVAEEGRGGNNSKAWATRFRRISGL